MTKTAQDAFAAIAAATREFQENLRTIRLEIAAKKEERDRVENLPPDVNHVMARIDEWVESTRRMVADLGDMSHWFTKPDARYNRVGSLSVGRPSLFNNFNDKAEYYLLPAIHEHLKADCRAALEGVETIAEAERSRQLEKIDADIAALEHGEEQLIRRADAAGLPAPRRRDASPAALLAADDDDSPELTPEELEHFRAVTGGAVEEDGK